MAVIKSICFLTLAFHMATSSDYSGILSNLYNKARDRNQPLVLVIDGSSKSSDVQSTVETSSNRNADFNTQIMDIVKKLQQKSAPRPLVGAEFDHPISDHSHSNLHRIQDSINQEILKRKERRLKKKADKQRNALESQQAQSGKHASFVNWDKETERKIKERNENRALRASVIKNLLRAYNDLNCEAKRDCQEIKRPEKQKNCEKKYEKFDCEKKRDENCNEGNDTCEADE